MYKKANVVMLPSNEKAKAGQLVINKEVNNELFIAWVDAQRSLGYHLYILSNDEIKEGDWIFANQGVHKVIDIKDDKYPYGTLNYKRDKIYHHNSWKKIIATTDKSLRLNSVKVPVSSDFTLEQISQNMPCLPQPSQSFIEYFVEQYNLGNIITEVMVEYELYKLSNSGNTAAILEDGHHGDLYRLKINPKDNTITIKKVKDSWNREEVINKFQSMYNEVICNKTLRHAFNKWVEENI